MKKALQRENRYDIRNGGRIKTKQYVMYDI